MCLESLDELDSYRNQITKKIKIQHREYSCFVNKPQSPSTQLLALHQYVSFFRIFNMIMTKMITDTFCMLKYQDPSQNVADASFILKEVLNSILSTSFQIGLPISPLLFIMLFFLNFHCNDKVCKRPNSTLPIF